MKRIVLTLYTIDELPDSARKKAIEEHGHLNVDHDWWEFTYDYFVDLCGKLGIAVDIKKIWFRGFYSQGDGSSFKASVDSKALIKSFASGTWRDVFPDIDLKIPPCPVDPRVLSLIERSWIDTSVSIETANRETSVRLQFNYAVNGGSKSILPLVDEQMEDVDYWIRDIVDDLNHHLYKTLENEYEYLTGPTAVLETIRSNEYLFTIDGKMAGYLEYLQEKAPPVV